jgi:hypothetical protein
LWGEGSGKPPGIYWRRLVDEMKERYAKPSVSFSFHLNAPQGFASDIANLYEINSIPHYFLIDKKGNIINADAPRPSSKPDEIIEKLLQ